MNAHQFAEWLAELLESTCERRKCSCNARAKADNDLVYAADSGACAIHIVITDHNLRTAEVVYTEDVGEWTWEGEIDLPMLRRRLLLVEEVD